VDDHGTRSVSTRYFDVESHCPRWCPQTGANANFSVRGLRAPPEKIGSHLILRPPQQFRQLGDVDRDAPRLVLGQPLHRHAPYGLIFEIDIGKGLAILVADAQAFGGLIDVPRWRECGAG
jgi:hypothetical protein